jgi:glyoxylase-like metal-dependent hydrolase (beta-lactamase superfamily II)
VRATELAPGIFHLAGFSHNSLAIIQSQGITLVEAPFDEIRSKAVIGWLKTNFPNTFIAYVVSSHHHADHSAGLRTYSAVHALHRHRGREQHARIRRQPHL